MRTLERRAGESIWIGREARLLDRDHAGVARLHLDAPVEIPVLADEDQPCRCDRAVWVLASDPKRAELCRIALEACGVSRLTLFTRLGEMLDAAGVADHGGLPAPGLVLTDASPEALPGLRRSQATRYCTVVALEPGPGTEHIERQQGLGTVAQIYAEPSADEVIDAVRRIVGPWAEHGVVRLVGRTHP